MSGVHQFVPMLHVGDAVGEHSLRLRGLLRERGVASEIYVEREDPETASTSRPARDYPGEAEPGDVLVYQFATESPLVPWLAARSEALVLNYHNVTPPESFASWDNGLARAQLRARQQLGMLVDRATVAVAVSEFNRDDLLDAGYRVTAVIPPLVDIPAGPDLPAPASDNPDSSEVPGRPDRSRETECRNWLMVGRLAPNKAVEAVVDALFLYRLRHDPDAELVVVGRPAVGPYFGALQDHVAELGLTTAVCFAGRVDAGQLAQAYRRADVLVVASEHEGFCLPVVEAMAHGLPVIAYRQGAVPEVLGDAGVLVDRRDPLSLGEAVRRLASDGAERRRVITAGRRRLAALGLETAGPRMVELLCEVAAGRTPTGLQVADDR